MSDRNTTEKKTCECGRVSTYFVSPNNGKKLLRGFCDSCYEDRCRRESNKRLDRIQKFRDRNQYDREDQS